MGEANWGWEFGLQKPLCLRLIPSSWNLGIRVLYASDLHLRPDNHERLLEELEVVVREHQPQVILLGGDYLDHPGSLKAFAAFLLDCSESSQVLAAVTGNHDRIFGLPRLRQVFRETGVRLLTEQPITMGPLRLIGETNQYQGDPFTILCAHYPSVFCRAIKLGIPLTLAGHLHGWQIVLWEGEEFLFPGALFSRWNGLDFTRGQSRMVVSRGMTDLLPIRYNCPREVLLLEL